MCNCVEEINTSLAEYNTRLISPITLTNNKLTATPKIIIATEKVDKKKSHGPVKLMPSYCPFCGEKL